MRRAIWRHGKPWARSILRKVRRKRASTPSNQHVFKYSRKRETVLAFDSVKVRTRLRVITRSRYGDFAPGKGGGAADAGRGQLGVWLSEPKPQPYGRRCR